MSTELTKIEQSNVKEINFLKEQAIELAKECNTIEIKDDTSEAIATQILSKANAYVKDIDKKRKELKAPVIDLGKNIDAAAKGLSGPLEEAVVTAKGKLLAWKQKKAQEAEKEAKRLRELSAELNLYSVRTMAEIAKCKTEAELGIVYKQRIKAFPVDTFEELGKPAINEVVKELVDHGKKKRYAILNPEVNEVVNEDAVETTQAIAEKTEAVAAEKVAAIDTSTSGLRKTWTYEIVDESVMPRDWLSPDPAKIKATMKVAIASEKLKPGADEIVNGVRFYQKESVRVV